MQQLRRTRKVLFRERHTGQQPCRRLPVQHKNRLVRDGVFERVSGVDQRAQRDLPLFQPKRKLLKRARRMLRAGRKKEPTNRYAQCPDGAQRQRADRIIPVARNAHESCTGQLRERRHSACKHAAHRAERRRQPRKVPAGSEGKQAHPHRRAELHQTAAQKSQLRQHRCHRVHAAEASCRNQPPPEKLLPAQPRAACKKPRINRRVERKKRFCTKPHAPLPFPLVLDKV